MRKRYIVIKTKDLDAQHEIAMINGVTGQHPLTRGLINSDIIDADDSAYDQIARSPHVVSVTEDRRIRLPDPVKSLMSQRTIKTNLGIVMHNIDRVWKEGYQGNGIRVGVLDTGLDDHHAEETFGKRIIAQRNFTRSRSVEDRNGHGTHVAGTIAGDPRVGVAPMAELVIAKVLDDDGYGFTSAILQGVEWCVSQGCHVINLSLGGSYCFSNDPLKMLLTEVRGHHIIPVVAAGNNGCHIGNEASVTSPACADDALTVAALNHHGEPASFSSCGDVVDIAAFGDNVLSYWLNGRYNIISGTSMAAPQVAGAAALLLSATRDGVLRRSVWRSLLSGAKDVPYGPIHVGVGSLDVFESLLRAQRK